MRYRPIASSLRSLIRLTSLAKAPSSCIISKADSSPRPSNKKIAAARCRVSTSSSCLCDQRCAISHLEVSSASGAQFTRTVHSRLTCNKQYNICRRTYSLFAANSLESRSLYTYCAKSYSESRYSSFHVTSSASKHLALLTQAVMTQHSCHTLSFR
jgi:hypothetical protein